MARGMKPAEIGSESDMVAVLQASVNLAMKNEDLPI